jgi:hypothetical protein
MGEVIWIEVLSRHRDVIARHRCRLIEGGEIGIGRGYANDVIIDDPHVGAQHLRVARDASGVLIAQDAGGGHGLFTERGRHGLERIVLDGDHPIRIGRTYLRVREARHGVAPAVEHRHGKWTWPAIAGLSSAVVGWELVSIWLAETAEPKLAHYASPVLGVLCSVLAWTTMWAIISRIFAGQARFERHLLIAVTGLFVVSMYNELTGYGAFALSSGALASYASFGLWLVAAAVCFFHLRTIGPGRLSFKAGAVTALAVLGIVAQLLAQSEMRSTFGQYAAVSQLKPPLFRLTPAQTEDTFFADVEKLQPRLDRGRNEEPSAGGLFSGFDADE